MTNTRILMDYEYRDASNNRTGGQRYFTGEYSQEKVDKLLGLCMRADIPMFVPEAVNIPSLVPEPYDDELDHPFHQITDIRPVTPSDVVEDILDPERKRTEAIMDPRTLDDLIEAFTGKDWEQEGAIASMKY